MFGRKPPAGNDSPRTDMAGPAMQPAVAPRPITPSAPPRPTPVGESDTEASAPKPAIPAQPARRPAEPIRAADAPREIRKLVVSKDITLSGEISACDHLIVQGTVEALVKECHRMEIAESGLFRGTVEISEADIGGRFEGEITVQGRLTVRATGRINGKVKYGELAVEAGGTLDGTIQGVGKAAKSAAGIKAPSDLSNDTKTDSEPRAAEATA